MFIINIILPDISKWKTDNAIDMSYMFSNCKSLLSLPNISKWKINNDNLISTSHIFNNCNSLLSLPDISEWKTNNIIDMSYIFFNCNSILSLPDISTVLLEIDLTKKITIKFLKLKPEFCLY